MFRSMEPLGFLGDIKRECILGQRFQLFASKTNRVANYGTFITFLEVRIANAQRDIASALTLTFV